MRVLHTTKPPLPDRADAYMSLHVVVLDGYAPAMYKQAFAVPADRGYAGCYSAVSENASEYRHRTMSRAAITSKTLAVRCVSR